MFARLNQLFQTEKPVEYMLNDRLVKLLKDLMTCFVTRGQIMTHIDIVDINLLDTDNLLVFDDMDQVIDIEHEDIVDCLKKQVEFS